MTEEFNEKKITRKELQKCEGEYSESGLKSKIVKYGKIAGATVVYKAVQLFYVLQKPGVPARTKAVIIGALGYLIAPIDFMPDLTLVIGYTDDAVALTFALVQAKGYIDDGVMEKSKKFLVKIFGKSVLKSIKEVNV
ncbi:MAG: DUF1232 domain-containing protein [Phascolarctobacterium sp.]|nr:DUF1232 domain-containing protein [Phascolarctobacterium sp.]